MRGRTVVATLLVVVALVAIAAGVIYIAVPIHSLPSFFPGHAHGVGKSFDRKHTKRGLAALGVGVVCLVVAAVVAFTGEGRSRSRRY